MPDYEVSANNIMYQFFPGENIVQGKGTVDAAGLHGPVTIPGDFYSNPERSFYRYDAYFPTHTLPLSPVPFLYTNEGSPSLYPELDQNSSMGVYQSPRTWLDSGIYLLITSGTDLSVGDMMFSSVAFDNVVLTQEHNIAIQDMLHSLALDNVVLTQDHFLVLADMLHSNAIDNIVLTQEHNITIGDMFHLFFLDGPVTLTEDQIAAAGGFISLIARRLHHRRHRQ